MTNYKEEKNILQVFYLNHSRLEFLSEIMASFISQKNIVHEKMRSESGAALFTI